MDLTKELSLLNSGNTTEQIFNTALHDFILAEKKLHIMAVMNLAQNLENIASFLLNDMNISVIKFIDFNIQNKPNKYVSSFEVHFIDKNLEQFDFRHKIINSKQKITKFYETTKQHRFKLEYTNNFDSVTIDLQGNIKEQIYNILLSPELKTTLEYHQMHLTLNNKKEKQPTIKI